MLLKIFVASAVCSSALTAWLLWNKYEHRLMLCALTNQHSSLKLSSCLTLPCSFNNWFNLQPQPLSLRLRVGRRDSGGQRQREESERGHRSGVNKRNSERIGEWRTGWSKKGKMRKQVGKEKGKQVVEREMTRMWAKLSMRLNWCVSCWSSYLKSFRHSANPLHTHPSTHMSQCVSMDGLWNNSPLGTDM